MLNGWRSAVLSMAQVKEKFHLQPKYKEWTYVQLPFTNTHVYIYSHFYSQSV